MTELTNCQQKPAKLAVQSTCFWTEDFRYIESRDAKIYFLDCANMSPDLFTLSFPSVFY